MGSGLPIFLVDAICLLVSVAVVLVAKGQWRLECGTVPKGQIASESWYWD